MSQDGVEKEIGRLLIQKGLSLALAESCTGGLVGHLITNVPGSSEYFLGGIVAYSYEAKVKLLDVSWNTLEKHGAVSRETVIEMARGARHALKADIGMAVSGIAGPGGGMPGKPVGLTWIGLSHGDFEDAWSYVWEDNRIQNKEHSAEQLLRLLSEFLLSQ